MNIAALNAERQRIIAFAGVPSYQKRIDEIDLALSSTAQVSLQDFTQRNANQDSEIATKADKILGSGRLNLYIGGPLASDNNDGLTEETPCATFSALLGQADLSQPLRAQMLSDVSVEELYSTPNRFTSLDITSKTGEFHKLKFTGDGRFSFAGCLSLRILNAYLENDKTNGSTPFTFDVGGGVRLLDCEIGYTQAAVDVDARPFFFMPAFSQFQRHNTIVHPSAQGKLFEEITGSDFNARALRN